MIAQLLHITIIAGSRNLVAKLMRPQKPNSAQHRSVIRD